MKGIYITAMFRIIKYYLYNFYFMILYNAVLNWNNFCHETSEMLKNVPVLLFWNATW